MPTLQNRKTDFASTARLLADRNGTMPPMDNKSPTRSPALIETAGTPAAAPTQAPPLRRVIEVMAPEAAPAPAQAAPGIINLGFAQPAQSLPGNVHQMWALDPALTFLNHGSYGSAPKSVLRVQAAYRERMERDPVRLFKYDLERLMDTTRERVASFINVNPADLSMMRNATYAMCTILKNHPLKAGDEVLITDHEYGSLHNELERMRIEQGIVVVKAAIPFPIASPQVALDAIVSRVTSRTKLVVISHVTSTSAMVLPAGKWLSGPKGSAFVYVRPDKQHLFRPLALSSRANKVRPERALFLRDFDYQGTDDYSAMVTLPAAIDAMGAILPGGWPALMRHNHHMILQARKILCEHLGSLYNLQPCVPDAMVGTMVTLKLPEPPEHLKTRPTCYDDALQDVLLDKYRIVVPIWRLMSTNERIIRVSAQVYNTTAEYEYLAQALKTELDLEQRG